MQYSESNTWAIVTKGIRSGGISCHEAVKSSMSPITDPPCQQEKVELTLLLTKSQGEHYFMKLLAVSSRGKSRTETIEECKCDARPAFLSWDGL